MTDNKKIFSDIYENGMWSKPFFAKGKYSSGSGSYKKYIIKPYIDFLKSFIKNNDIKSITDVGCGDFNIMRRVLVDFPDIVYYGIDVAENLINYNNEKYSDKNKHFYCLDVSNETEKLPKADLFICRQVLQHLSNKDVAAILDATKNYHYAIITDSIYVGDDMKYNLDMPTGEAIRLPMKSGIYIDKPPFSMKNVAHVLSVNVYEPRRSLKSLFSAGRLSIANIRTSLIINK